MIWFFWKWVGGVGGEGVVWGWGREWRRRLGGAGGVHIGSHGLFVNSASKDCCGSYQMPSHSAEKVYNSV